MSGTPTPYLHGKQPAWRLRVSLGPDPARPGKYLQHQEVFRGSKRAAQARLDSLSVDVARGEHDQPTAGATFGELLDEWLASRRAKGLSPTTVDGYSSIIELWWRPTCGSIPLAKLTNRDLDRVFAKMAAAGKSAATIERVHAVARQALRQGQAWHWLSELATVGTTRPTVYDNEVVPPTVEQLMMLVERAQAIDPTGTFRTLLLTASAVGARRGELCAIQWQDVDLEARQIHVRRAVIVRKVADGRFLLKPTKNHVVRHVDLSVVTAAALGEHRDNVAATAAAAGHVLAPEGYVFADLEHPDGRTPLPPDKATRLFRRAAKDCGLLATKKEQAAGKPSVRLQDMRHLAASLQLGEGVDRATIINRMGWRDGAMLERYGHMLPGAGRAAADKVGERLARAYEIGRG